MLRFFRQLRQHLINEDRFGRYLLYAIGEILLVVIGILIALQVSKWNARNLDRKSETDYLKRLSADLARDTFNYSWTSNTLLNKQKALENLLAYLNTDRQKDPDSSELIQTIFLGRLLSFAHPDVMTGTFEELKNTGNFKQIESTSLRSAISGYYSSRAHQFQRIEEKRLEPGYGDEVDTFIPGLKRVDGAITYRADLVSFEDIVEHVKTAEFKKFAISEYNFAIFMHAIQATGLERSKNLLRQVTDELNKP